MTEIDDLPSNLRRYPECYFCTGPVLSAIMLRRLVEAGMAEHHVDHTDLAPGFFFAEI